jgi:hypothetical protein
MNEQQPHATPETIRQLLRSALPSEETTQLVRHLLACCPECLLAAGQAAWVERSEVRRFWGDRATGKGWRGRRR